MARIPLLQQGLTAEVAPSMLIDSWSERVSASLAHSINNPLEAAIGALYMASHNPDTPPVVQDELKTAQDQLHRLAQLLQRVLSPPKEVDSGLT